MSSLRSFMKSARGALLDIRYQPASPVGFAHERCLRFRKGFHAHDSFVLCAARGATRARILCKRTGTAYVNDRSVVVFKPPGFVHSVTGLTSLYDDFALFFEPELVRDIARGEGAGDDELRLFCKAVQVLPRSQWLNELLEQLFLVRVLGAARSADSLKWIEREVIRELCALGGLLSKPAAARLPPVPLQTHGLLARAIEFIEANLFTLSKIDEVVKSCGTSRSVLYKAFQSGLRTKPAEYIRNRKLEEAQRLLRSGEFSVSEVAHLAGYESAAAFTRAYSRKFSQPPRSAKKQGLAAKP